MTQPSPQDCLEVLRRFGRLPDGEVEPLGGLGGLSGAAFFRFFSRGQPMLLKALPGVGWGGEQLDRTHQALRFAGFRGIDFLPVPLQAVDGPTFVVSVNRLWELTPWLRGAPVLDRPLEKNERDAGVAAIARLHAIWADYDEEPSSAGRMTSLRRRVAAWRQATSAEWIRSPARLSEPGWMEPGHTRRLAQWVEQLLPRVGESLHEVETQSYPLQTIIGDARREHLLFSGQRVTGLVDFGAMTFDSPMVDLTRLLGELAGDDASVWSDAIACYRSRRPTSDAELQLLPVLDMSGVVLSAFNWLGWLAVERREFPDPNAVVRRMEHLTRRLETLACGDYAASTAVNRLTA